MDTNQVVIQDFVINACVDHFIGATEEQKKNMLVGILNSMDTNLLVWLQGEVEQTRGRGQNTFNQLQHRFDALRESEEEILANLDTSLNASGTRLNDSIEVDTIEVDPQEPTTADMPEGSSDITVDPLLDESVEVGPLGQGQQAMSMGMNQGDMGEREREMERLRQQLGTTTDYQSPDVDLRTGYQNSSSQPASHPYGEWVREAEENMNRRNIVASERQPTQVENDTGEARKKKTKKKRRKSKKKKKPYEDLIITQKKRLAKLQKMSEKLSKKMSKTKKKRRKKKVSDSY